MARILVVEDDRDLLDLYHTALLQARHEVWVAGSLWEARAVFQDMTPDLMILDMTMPDGRGTDLIDDVHGDPRFAHTQIIVITANEQWAVETEARDVESFLVKPVTLQNLIALVARLTL